MNIGLTPKQLSLYQSALSLGQSTMTELSTKANLKRPTTYLIVDELLKLGLLSQTKIGKTKVYSPVHPRRLLEIARHTKKNIEDSLPELLALYNQPKNKPKIQVFEGKTAIINLYKEMDEVLRNKKEILFYSNIHALKTTVPEAMNDYIKRLARLKESGVQSKIRELNYHNQAALDWSKAIKPYQSPNHHIRLLKSDHPLGFTDMMCYENKVAIFSLNKDIFVTTIESSEIIKSYRALFETAWEASS